MSRLSSPRPSSGSAWDNYEQNLTPDLVVLDQAYIRTGVLNANGDMILKRVSRPIGFAADFDREEYIVEPE